MTAPGTLASASRLALAIRRSKVACFQARRLLDWAVFPGRWRVPGLGPPAAAFPHVVYEHERVIARTDPGADPVLEEGKRVNLALAAPHFDGLVLASGQVLSFWRTLGRVTAARGFRHGTELRGGCIVPTIGGGLCALSGALFQMACVLGWAIVERYGHTREAAPADGPVWGLDATVLWPQVDLRIAPRQGPVRLAVAVAGDVLRIRVEAAVPAHARVTLESIDDVTFAAGQARFRRNQVLRTMASGSTMRQEVVAINHRQLLHAVEQRRNCLTCNQSGCRARPRDLPRAPAEAP